MDDAPRSDRHAEIVARWKPVCLCNGIKQGRVAAAIAAGARSVEEVARETGCTTGSCHGERCTPVIERLLRERGRP